MIRRTYTAIAGLCLALQLMAAPVTPEGARRLAAQFVTSQMAWARGEAPHTAQLTAVPLGDLAADRQLYAFNIGSGEGFVIVSGDDATESILAYADHGTFSTEAMPENLRAWLRGYAGQVSYAAAHHIRKAQRQNAPKKSVGQLLATQWNQTEPYNNTCPTIFLDSKLQQPATGCVATATAQLLCYHGRKMGTPTTIAKAIPAYESKKCELFGSWANDEHTSLYTTNTVAEKPVRTFDWSKLKDKYPVADEAATEEVARLMEYAGAAVQMQYSSSSSAATENVARMLPVYFGYDADIKTIYRNNMTYQEWLDAIYAELATNGPVLVGGQSLTGGHAFVIDGFSTDDFFHVNWGWGGTSDGFYRLQALTPESQGTGGSDSGYTMDLNAIVNVKPVDDGTSQAADMRLTVTNLTIESPTYPYDRYNGNFFENDGSNLHYLIAKYAYSNNTGTTASFEWGTALYQGDELVKLCKENGVNDDLDNGAGSSGYFGTTFGEGLSDGTYQYVLISRPKGSTEWQKCIGSDEHYVEVTISGDNLKLTNVTHSAVLASTTAALVGEAVKDEPTTVKFQVANNGDADFTGTLKLIWQNGSSNVALAGKTVDIAPGATPEIEFTFTPTQVGEMNLVLWDKKGNCITSTPLTITVVNGASSTTGTLGHVSTVLKNGADGEVFGYSVQASVTLSNSGTTAHSSGIKVMLFKWDNAHGGTGTSVSIKTYDVTIPAGGQATFDVELGGMEKGGYYSLGYYYTDNTEIDNSIRYNGTFTPVDAITVYKAEGAWDAVKQASNVTVPADALAVDLTACDASTTVTRNGNPNTVYIVGGNMPGGLEGCNVVSNGVAQTLTLSDGYAFYTPVTFTAQTATYTRQFANGADGTKGWTTLALPFDVTEVTADGIQIDWFHSATDTGKNFWLKTFCGDDPSTVYFDFADKMEANTPYIIAVPGNKWGNKWNLTGKDIVFHGTEVTVTASAKIALSASNYRFEGTTADKAVTYAYILNSDGNMFELQTAATVAPFRACFTPSDMKATYASVLTIGSGNTTTGIGDAEHISQPTVDAAIYSLDGRRITEPAHGIYIKNGKKYVK